MASNLSIDALHITFSCSEPSSAGACSTFGAARGREIDRYSPHLTDPLREKFSRYRSNPNPTNQKNGKFAGKSPEPLSPAASSRYLLHEIPAVGYDFSDSEQFPPITLESLKGAEDLAEPKPPSPPQRGEEVVVLRVSLHCKGCERKVRKHISRMKGVTSFSTDIASKKVTVKGAVTPLSVLNSISKVKKAQFWSS